MVWTRSAKKQRSLMALTACFEPIAEFLEPNETLSFSMVCRDTRYQFSESRLVAINSNSNSAVNIIREERLPTRIEVQWCAKTSNAFVWQVQPFRFLVIVPPTETIGKTKCLQRLISSSKEEEKS